MHSLMIPAIPSWFLTPRASNLRFSVDSNTPVHLNYFVLIKAHHTPHPTPNTHTTAVPSTRQADCFRVRL